MGQAADAPNPETRLQWGSRRVEYGVEDYAASYTGLEDSRDTKSQWAVVGVGMKIPLKRLSSSVRPRQILPPLNRHGITGLIIAVPEKVGQIGFRAERKKEKYRPCSLDSLPSIVPTKGSHTRAQSLVFDYPRMPPSSDASLLRKS
jgi:hypothetical protein